MGRGKFVNLSQCNFVVLSEEGVRRKEWKGQSMLTHSSTITRAKFFCNLIFSRQRSVEEERMKNADEASRTEWSHFGGMRPVWKKKVIVRDWNSSSSQVSRATLVCCRFICRVWRTTTTTTTTTSLTTLLLVLLNPLDIQNLDSEDSLERLFSSFFKTPF